MLDSKRRLSNPHNSALFNVSEGMIGEKVMKSEIGCPPRDSNPDMLIQRPSVASETKQLKGLPAAESGKLEQNPHHPRTKESTANVAKCSAERDEGYIPPSC